MKKLFLLLFCLIYCISYAQGDGASGNAFNMGTGGNKTTLSQTMLSKFRTITENRNSRMDNTTGSAYLTDIFLPTKLYYDNQFMNNIYYRYNAYNKEIEVKQSPNEDNQNVAALNKDKKIAILVDNHKMSFKTFVTSKKKTINGYLMALLNGKKYDLYKRIHIIFSPGRASTNSFVKAVPNRFTKFTEYYFQKEGVNRIDEILPNNRQFLKLLDDSAKNDIKTFLKENKLNVKNEADLVKVFEYLNR